MTTLPTLVHGQSTPARPRITATLFDSDLVIEVLPLEEAIRTRDGLADALDEARAVEGLLRVGNVLSRSAEKPNGVEAINAAAGNGPVAIDPRVQLVLGRALEFCRWSRGAFGPLGGMLNGLWGLRQRAGGLPSTSALAEQAAAANCDRLQIDAEGRTATLASGSRIDLWGLARGLAADRTVGILLDRGFTNGWVQIGHVIRAFGPGPDGNGWPMAVEPVETREVPAERVFLLDRSLAMASLRERTLEVGGERFAPYIDHRTGWPAAGKAAVLVSSETALDAEALASALFVLSSREGEFHLGTLRPQPAVKWFLGVGEGPPLVMQRHWSTLEQWQP